MDRALEIPGLFMESFSFINPGLISYLPHQYYSITVFGFPEFYFTRMDECTHFNLLLKIYLF